MQPRGVQRLPYVRGLRPYGRLQLEFWLVNLKTVHMRLDSAASDRDRSGSTSYAVGEVATRLERVIIPA